MLKKGPVLYRCKITDSYLSLDLNFPLDLVFQLTAFREFATELPLRDWHFYLGVKQRRIFKPKYEKVNKEASLDPCSPSDYYIGGKCGLNGCL